ncbi:MAG: type II toxin-antitoxin system YafQ family toxin, partial [Actinomycetes bacterium]
MREVELTSKFKKDYKRERKNPNHKNLELILNVVVKSLQNDEILSPSYRAHKLIGKFNEYEECHLKQDLLLIYLKLDNKLKLIRMGS